jgi:hypothetical protein
MKSTKSAMREAKSEAESGGDRRAGSVGERPELAGSRDSGNRSVGSRKSRGHSVEEEISDQSDSGPVLGGE